MEFGLCQESLPIVLRLNMAGHILPAQGTMGRVQWTCAGASCALSGRKQRELEPPGMSHDRSTEDALDLQLIADLLRDELARGQISWSDIAPWWRTRLDRRMEVRTDPIATPPGRDLSSIFTTLRRIWRWCPRPNERRRPFACPP